MDSQRRMLYNTPIYVNVGYEIDVQTQREFKNCNFFIDFFLNGFSQLSFEQNSQNLVKSFPFSYIK